MSKKRITRRMLLLPITALLVGLWAGFGAPAAAQSRETCFRFQNGVLDPTFRDVVTRRWAEMAEVFDGKGARFSNCGTAQFTIVAYEMGLASGSNRVISYNIYRSHKVDLSRHLGRVTFRGIPGMIELNDQDYQRLLDLMGRR